MDAPCGFQAPLQRFTIELIARVSLYGRRFFWSDDWLWNWLDVTIVASSFVPCDMFCCHTFSSNVADVGGNRWKQMWMFDAQDVGPVDLIDLMSLVYHSSGDAAFCKHVHHFYTPVI